MTDSRTIGHVVAVHGLRVKVELLPEVRSPLRATLAGVQEAVAINAYLTFSTGAGRVVVGTITDLQAHESFDPATGEDLSLELIKPRRIATVQLLGLLDDGVFSPGVTLLPTLDTPAEIGVPELLKAIFEAPPQRNRPEDYQGTDFDAGLRIGVPTGERRLELRASYNDLFSRPLAIVGNTGSGKSYTVASLLQNAMDSLSDQSADPRVFVLDTNGEYGRVFSSSEESYEKVPNSLYLNGKEFGIPIWLFNAQEICTWLSAAEQTQEPVLKDWWAIAKSDTGAAPSSSNRLQSALATLDGLLAELPKLKRKSAGSYCDAICGYLEQTDIAVEVFRRPFEEHRGFGDFNTEVLANAAEVETVALDLRNEITEVLLKAGRTGHQQARTADSPLYVPYASLTDPSLLNRATSRDDTFRIEAHLTTLRLRLKTRLDDRRWRSFLNYEEPQTALAALDDWLMKLGIGESPAPRVSVLDLSMLSSEVLPYACSIVGRLLLEAREYLPASQRYRNPWVLVLEEAHNYVRPARADEDRGHRLARLTYERIAKEGRKFGLSLLIASQRPSEVSPTIVSQCANFISHRLQNPADIDYFLRIIPVQARRLLDQVTVLASGEAIAFGSAFHVPSRVQIDLPKPAPYSQTAAPFLDWSKGGEPFPIDDVVHAWGAAASELPTQEPREPPSTTATLSPASESDLGDDIPF